MDINGTAPFGVVANDSRIDEAAKVQLLGPEVRHYETQWREWTALYVRNSRDKPRSAEGLAVAALNCVGFFWFT